MRTVYCELYDNVMKNLFDVTLSGENMREHVTISPFRIYRIDYPWEVSDVLALSSLVSYELGASIQIQIQSMSMC